MTIISPGCNPWGVVVSASKINEPVFGDSLLAHTIQKLSLLCIGALCGSNFLGFLTRIRWNISDKVNHGALSIYVVAYFSPMKPFEPTPPCTFLN